MEEMTLGRIEEFNEYFEVKVTPDKMKATIQLIKQNHQDISFTKEELVKELQERSICYGYFEDAILQISEGLSEDSFPIIVAEGTPPEKGKDGQVEYTKELSTSLDYQDKEQINFREVMRIPSVHNGDKLLTICAPEQGKPGKNIYGEEIPAPSGKPVSIKAGTNVEWNAADNSMYSTADGQISIGENIIHVYPLYEVASDIDMKIGNLDFVGSIVIRGNVPNGYTVKAKGDITVYGLVEGATIIADGSVNISEGVAATSKGGIYAGLDVKAGYVNQANIEAGRDIFIENTIIHSHCIARENIYCQKGNIIGGSLSAGASIIAKEVGNKMNTATNLFFGVNKKIVEKESELQTMKSQLEDSLKKLALIGNKLNEKKEKGDLTAKERITLLRQRNSYLQNEKQLLDINEMLEEIKEKFGDQNNASLSVEGMLYSNTDVTFGKYRRNINKNHKNVKVFIEKGEICVHPLT